MVLFDQLRISDDGKRMYINVRVNNASYFDNIYLDSLTIVTADKVSETSPHVPSEDYVYQKTFEDEVKSAGLVLLPTDFNEQYMKSSFSGDLFFVYVKVKGTPDPCTPCTLDEEITLGVTFDEGLLYQRVMQYTKDLADSCQIPVGLTDLILQWNGFKAAVETEHYIPAIKYYNMMFNSPDVGRGTFTTKHCGCNG